MESLDIRWPVDSTGFQRMGPDAVSVSVCVRYFVSKCDNMPSRIAILKPKSMVKTTVTVKCKLSTSKYRTQVCHISIQT